MSVAAASRGSSLWGPVAAIAVVAAVTGILFPLSELGRNGLLGTEDRLSALERRLTVESAPGEGTILRASIPLGGSVVGVAHVSEDGKDPAMLGGGRADA